MVGGWDEVGRLEKKNTHHLSAGGGGGLVARLCPTLEPPPAAAHQGPLSMGFPRQEYWSG